jgi:hypothetical protein
MEITFSETQWSLKIWVQLVFESNAKCMFVKYNVAVLFIKLRYSCVFELPKVPIYCVDIASPQMHLSRDEIRHLHSRCFVQITI